MTEEHWLTCDDPHVMLEFLRGRASKRKIRLFACACCRRVVSFHPDARSLHSLDVGEWFADGDASAEELNLAWREQEEAGTELSYLECRWSASAAMEAVSCAAGAALLTVQRFRIVPESDPDPESGYSGPIDVAQGVSRWAATAAGFARVTSAPEGITVGEVPTGGVPDYREELREQAALLRHVVGPHGSLPVARRAIEPDATVKSLAEAAYEDRLMPSGELDPVRLSVLADALEDVGADAELIEHLRGPGPHVRGCWVVDALLGRE
jgi:hypothetical protein